MSTTIDQRVVEMRFDNKEFEKNVQTSLSTLEKLKQKLNLTGASKGLEGIGRAAKNVDFSPMANSAEKVAVSISHTWATIQHQIDRYVDRMVDSAERAVKALTIDPIKTGLQEYETQIGAVQTILANTSHQGTTLNDVNSALDTLNQYADKTIYNFTEMTRNIGTFTAAGVDLQTSVDSIQGIANLAAVSGSTSQQASTAMYQLSQALAAGKVSLMDWNSVVNAGMGGKVFQDALIRTSELLNTGAEAAIKAHGSFRESLTKGEWLTTDVLTETLKQFAGAYTEADLIAQGFTEEQAKDIAALAETASDAATKVKTFTQLWDTLKEAAQSGWTQTWELIIGDFEEAKALWTGVSDVIGGFINNISESRNKWLGEALNTPWEKLIESVNKAGVTTEAFEAKVKEVAEDHGLDMDKIESQYESFEDACRSGAISSDILSEAMDRLGNSTADLSKITGELKMGDTGEDVKQLQEALKGLNYDFSKFGVDGIIGEETTAAIKAFQEAQGLKVTGIVDDKTLEALREATENSNSLIGKCKELTKGLDELGGRELMLQGFANIFDSMKLPIRAVKAAFKDIFPPTSGEVFIGFAEKFVEFTKSLKPSMGTIRKLHDTFEGLFSAVDIVVMAFKSVGKAIFGALGSKGLGDIIGNVLDVTSALGRFVTKIRDAIKVGNTFDSIAVIVAAGIRKLLDVASIPADIIAGFVSGLSGGAGTIISAAIDIVSKFLNTVKDFLGIHSPSTETYDIAMNCILGFVNGVKAFLNLLITAGGDIGNTIINAIGEVLSNGYSTLKKLGTNFMNMLSRIFGEIDLGKILGIALSGGTVLISKKVFDIAEALSSPFAGIGDILDNVGETVGTFNDILEKSGKAIKKTINSFSKVLKGFGKLLSAKAFDLRATALLKIAAAIAVLAAAVELLTLVDQSKLKSATICLVSLVGSLAILGVVISKMMTISSLTDAAGIAAIGVMLVQLGIAIGLMAVSAKLLGSMDDAAYTKGLAAIGGLLVLVSLISVLLSTNANKDVSKFGSMLLKLSISMLLLVAVCKLMSGLSPGEILAGIGILTTVILFVALMAEFTQKTGDNVSKFGTMMLKLSVAMLLMVAVIKLIGGMEFTEALQGGAGLIVFMGVIWAMVKIVKPLEKDIPKIAAAILAMSGTMLVLSLVVKLIGSMKWNEALQGGLGVLALVGIIALMIQIIKPLQKDIPKISAALLAMSVSIGILAAVAVVLSLIDPVGLLKGVTAVGILAVLVSMMTKSLGGVYEAQGTMIGLAVVIGVLAASVVALSFIKPDKLLGATLAMSMLIASFSLVAKGSKDIDGAMKSLIVLTVTVAVLAGALYLLSGLPIEDTIGTAAALSILMLGLSASMKIISKVGTSAMKALPTMGMLALIIGILGTMLGLLTKYDLVPSMETVTSLSVFLLAMSATCVILGAVGRTGAAAIQGAAVLMGVIAIIGGVAALIGWLMSLIPQDKIEEWKTGLQGFMDFIVILAGGLGDAIGAFIGGAIGGSLEAFSTQLNTLADAISTFSTKISSIDQSSLDSVTSLGQMIALITGASIVDGIYSFVTGTSTIDSFSTQLSAFGDAIVDFSQKVSGNINEEAVNAAANAGNMLAALQNGIASSGGVVQWFTGEKNLADFGVQLMTFGDAIVGFSKKVSGNINEEAVAAAANAGSLMAEMQSKIVPSGGVIQWFTGEKDMSAFATQLVAFGSAITQFSTSVAGGINEEAVTAAANAGSVMSTMQEKLVGTGGVIQWFTGEKDIATFGTQLVSFGNAIVSFSQTVTGNINEEAITAAANVGSLMANMQSKIVPSGGVIQWFTGEKDMTTFATQVVAFGSAIVAFSNEVSGNIDEGAVTAAANAGTVMASLQKSLPEERWFDGKMNLADFGDKLSGFGKGIKGFSDKIVGIDAAAVTTAVSTANRLITLTEKVVDLDTSGISKFSKIEDIGYSMANFGYYTSGLDTNSVSSMITSANRLKTFVNSLKDIDTSGISTFKSAIESLCKIDMSSFDIPDLSGLGSSIVASIASGIASKSTLMTATMSTNVTNMLKNILDKTIVFKDAGIALMNGFITGLRTASKNIATAVNMSIALAVTSIRTKRTSFYTAGEWLGDGLVQGMKNKEDDAYRAGYRLGQKAVEGEKEGQKSNSPSKLTEQAGKWLGEGLVIGINRMTNSVYKSGKNLGKTAADSMTTTASRLAAAIDTDIDANPTIRPVLDLSDVTAGANSISTMLSGSTIGVTANVGAISTMMNNRRQNGANAEIISAIGKLNDRLNNLGNTTYQVNGITYDDGSNISAAVRSLVHAAKVERRI